MKKSEIASYLVSLHTLMANETHSVSPILAMEFKLHWDMLQSKIKEDYNETGQSAVESNGLNQNRTGQQGNFARGSLADGSKPSPGDD
jgi:hypothetical protein